MKSIKLALLGGAALAVTAAGAQAEDLDALKAQIESLNARVAAMEAAPSVPAGYQLLTVSEGQLRDIPGLELTPGEKKRAGTKATVISVLPTADAPAGATITWSGRVASGLVYRNDNVDIELHFHGNGKTNESSVTGDYLAGKRPFGGWTSVNEGLELNYTPSGSIAGTVTSTFTGSAGTFSVTGSGGTLSVTGSGSGSFTPSGSVSSSFSGTFSGNAAPAGSIVDVNKGLIEALKLGKDQDKSEDAEYSLSTDEDDLDVYANSRLRVTAATDTAVGEVGVTMEMRADMDGRTDYDVYMNEAWGYWAMTPELTFGGGYTGSLADIGYGYDGACSCYYIDNSFADMAVGPSDTTQLRLSYASGPFGMAIALEDASDKFSINGKEASSDRVGVAGQIKYSGDIFSGEISGGWWDVNEDEYFDVDTQWQVGAGFGVGLGDFASLSVAAAMGEGPTSTADSQSGVSGSTLPINNEWWMVSALASFNMTEEVHAELGGGYKKRDGDAFLTADLDNNAATYTGFDVSGFDYEVYSVMGGLYYTPVDQLTIGIEGEWSTSSNEWHADYIDASKDTGADAELSIDTETFVGAFVGVWRF